MMVPMGQAKRGEENWHDHIVIGYDVVTSKEMRHGKEHNRRRFHSACTRDLPRPAFRSGPRFSDQGLRFPDNSTRRTMHLR